MELLAPAGSMEALRAAVQNGADAVYLGGGEFNARQNAQNFDEEALFEAVSYAHLYGVAVHVTLNTLIFDRELPRIKAFLKLLAEAGADAVIVQDLGAWDMVKTHVPTLSMHASTQMTVHNLEGVRRLEALGFSRVVLSRELSLKEIRKICESTNTEIEVFGHGALCVSYSGQCLFSSLVGGRSGNRGQCAQPCRLPYTLLDEGKEVGEKGYLLSPKDLWTLSDISALKEAGVASLKLEGRLKRPAYVAAAVREYRRAIDGGDTGHSKETLAAVFNRDGFADAYLHGQKGPEMMSVSRPGNHGVFAGKVTGQKGNEVWFSAEKDLNRGDLLSVRSEKGETEGTLREPVKKGKIGSVRTAKRLAAAKTLWRITDAVLLEELEKTYETPYQTRRVSIKGEAHFAPGEAARLVLWDDLGNRAEAFSEKPLEEARGREAASEDIRKQLLKTGGTPYDLTLQIFLAPGVFAPVSVLNQLRRDALGELTKLRTRKTHLFYETEEHDEVRGADKRAPYEVVFVQNEAQLSAALPFRPKRIALPLGLLKSRHVSEHQETEWAAVLPRIIREKDTPKVKEALSGAPVKGVYISHFGHLSLTEGFVSYGDFALNITNQKALSAYREMGFNSLTLSPEMSLHGSRGLGKEGLEAIIYGRIPLMMTENCPASTLTACGGDCRKRAFSLLDRTGAIFPILADPLTHRSEIVNSLPLAMTDRREEVREIAEGLQLRFTVETAGEVKEVMKAYKEGKLPKGPYTRGHYDNRHKS